MKPLAVTLLLRPVPGAVASPASQSARDGFEGRFFAQQKTLRPEDLRVWMKPLAVTYSHMA